jgi:hypothetical protein
MSVDEIRTAVSNLLEASMVKKRKVYVYFSYASKAALQ